MAWQPDLQLSKLDMSLSLCCSSKTCRASGDGTCGTWDRWGLGHDLTWNTIEIMETMAAAATDDLAHFHHRNSPSSRVFFSNLPNIRFVCESQKTGLAFAATLSELLRIVRPQAISRQRQTVHGGALLARERRQNPCRTAVEKYLIYSHKQVEISWSNIKYWKNMIYEI